MATESPKPRIPFAASVANRADMPDVDSRLINGYLERQEDKTIHVYRRPGLALFHRFGAGGGRGIYNWQGDVYAIYGGRFYKNLVQVGSIIDNGKIFSFTAILGTRSTLFFHNGDHAYIWDNFGLIVTLVPGATIARTGSMTPGSVLITGLSSTTGILVNSGVVGDVGVLPGSYIVSIDSSTQVSMNAPSVTGAAGAHLTFTTPGFPSNPLVPGVTYLDGTTYVMDAKAKIYGSNINDVTSLGWEAVNTIIAQIEPDNGVCLAKQLVYVVAFKQWSTEFFYDAANPVGSPLGTVQGNKVSQGCRDAGTVASLEGDLFWVSTTREGNVDVYMMSGARPSPIGTPSIERLLQYADFTGCWSFGFHISGHKFYVLTLPRANFTLVYDMTSKEWARWTDPNDNYWPYVSATYGAQQQVLLQEELDGDMYQASATYFADEGNVIPFDLYTPNWDGGARTRKILTRMDFIGDQQPGTILKIRKSDDDYKSWSNYREVDMGKERPNLRDCGTFRRRAWHISNRTISPLRLQAAELHLSVGTD